MKTFWNTYKSSILLLAAMVAGGVIGFFWGPGASVLQPIADTFLNLLYCCVVPLIFCSLTAAIGFHQDHHLVGMRFQQVFPEKALG